MIELRQAPSFRTRITTCYPDRVETGALIPYQDYHMLLLTLAGRWAHFALAVAPQGVCESGGDPPRPIAQKQKPPHSDPSSPRCAPHCEPALPSGSAVWAPQCQNSRSVVSSVVLIPTVRRAWKVPQRPSASDPFKRSRRGSSSAAGGPTDVGSTAADTLNPVEQVQVGASPPRDPASNMR